MAAQLLVEDDRGNEYYGAGWWTKTDSKGFTECLLERSMLKVVQRHFDLDLRPLEKLGGALPWNWPPMDFEELWQPAEDIEQCIEVILQSLDQLGGDYSNLEHFRQKMG